MLKRIDTVVKSLTVVLLVMGVGCSGDDPAAPAADETPPAAGTDLLHAGQGLEVRRLVCRAAVPAAPWG